MAETNSDSPDLSSEILKRSVELFAMKGYETVSMNDIAGASKVSKPTLYYYYGSKRGLLDGIVQEYGSKYSSLLQKEAAYKGDIVDSLNRITLALILQARETIAFSRLRLSLWSAPPDSDGWRAIAELYESAQGIVMRLFEDSVKDHGNMRGRAKAYTATFLGMIDTYIGLELNLMLKLEEGDIYKAVHQFMHGIFS
jgi:AcrR family transcriptional regulator